MNAENERVEAFINLLTENGVIPEGVSEERARRFGVAIERKLGEDNLEFLHHLAESTYYISPEQIPEIVSTFVGAISEFLERSGETQFIRTARRGRSSQTWLMNQVATILEQRGISIINLTPKEEQSLLTLSIDQLFTGITNPIIIVDDWSISGSQVEDCINTIRLYNKQAPILICLQIATKDAFEKIQAAANGRNVSFVVQQVVDTQLIPPEIRAIEKIMPGIPFTPVIIFGGHSIPDNYVYPFISGLKDVPSLLSLKPKVY